MVGRNPGFRENVVILVASSCLFFACLLWLVSSIKSWRAYQVDRILSRGGNIQVDVLVEALEKSEDLPKDFFPSRYIHVPAFIAAALAEMKDETNPELINKGLELSRLALARDPSDSHAWAVFAYLNYLANGPSPRVVDALQLSICTKPWDRKLIFWRLALAAISHGYWTLEFTDFIRGQILIAFNINPRKLVETAQEYSFISLVRVALITETEELEKLEEYMKRTSKKPHRAKIPGP